eukprot:snap_masked-scaffold_6-processed-gene-16.44-mRNA-1 protein AED:1.00 eAED:1.00 QI:0/-1/0/0/-1/1/1/0/330
MFQEFSAAECCTVSRYIDDINAAREEADELGSTVGSRSGLANLSPRVLIVKTIHSLLKNDAFYCLREVLVKYPSIESILFEGTNPLENLFLLFGCEKKFFTSSRENETKLYFYRKENIVRGFGIKNFVLKKFSPPKLEIDQWLYFFTTALSESYLSSFKVEELLKEKEDIISSFEKGYMKAMVNERSRLTGYKNLEKGLGVFRLTRKLQPYWSFEETDINLNLDYSKYSHFHQMNSILNNLSGIQTNLRIVKLSIFTPEETSEGIYSFVKLLGFVTQNISIETLNIGVLLSNLTLLEVFSPLFFSILHITGPIDFVGVRLWEVEYGLVNQ